MLDNRELDDCDINITLLDKIYEHQQVVKHFIKLQLRYLGHGKPNAFLNAPDIGIETCNLAIQKRLSTIPGGGATIPLVTYEMATMVTKYKKGGLAKTYGSDFEYLDYLEIISKAMNCIVDGDIVQAQAIFERLNQILPILQEADQDITKRAQRFPNFQPEMRWIILDSICASAKCMWIDVQNIMRDQNVSRGFQHDFSIQSEQKRRIVDRRRMQVKHLAAYIDYLIQNKSYQSDKPHSGDQTLRFRVEAIGKLLRKIELEIS